MPQQVGRSPQPVRLQRPAVCAAVLAALLALLGSSEAATPAKASGTVHALGYAPAPVDNPLKGLVPYQDDRRALFPHSMEFAELPYSALVIGYDAFDWRPLETALNDIASRGHQSVIRVFLEYPGVQGAIPPFLLKDGLAVTRWDKNRTPDYTNPKLRRSLRAFVAAFGQRYDGDARLGFITAGLLGAYGEWHTYPREELFASKDVQNEVLDAYQSAFRTTPVLLRYPAGPSDAHIARNDHRPFGYHDDSFAWGTLHTGKPDDEWFYMTALQAAGTAAQDKWKTQPIGGEIRPEAWGWVFDTDPVGGPEQAQNFRQCVQATHASWLLDSGMFAKKQSPARIRQAAQEVQRMGYEFHVPWVVLGRVQGQRLDVQVALENRGVAPFYYDWRAQWGLVAEGHVVKAWASSGRLTGLLPGEGERTWADTLDVSGVAPGTYTLGLRVPHPLPGGKSLRFANETQDARSAGWLTLGEVVVP